MKKNLELRLIINNEVAATINAMLEFDNNNLYDEGFLSFQHPITGSMYENVRNIISGWTEEYNYLDQLIDLITSDTDLMQKAHDLDIIDYFIENI